MATAPVDLASPSLVVAGRVTTDDGPFTGTVELFLDDALSGTVEANAGIVRDLASAPTLFAGERIVLEARVDGEAVGELAVRGRIDGARERAIPAARGGGGCHAVDRPVRRTAPAALALLALLSRGRRLRSRRSRRRGASARRCRGRRASR